MGPYVLDFYCPAEKLAIELDGAPHFFDEQMKYDEIRTAYLNKVGIQVIRFENQLVLKHIEDVLASIRSHFVSRIPE